MTKLTLLRMKRVRLLFGFALMLGGGTANAADDQFLELASPNGDSAQVKLSTTPDAVTVNFVKQNFDLPSHVEFSYVDAKGIRRTLNLGAVSPRVLERPSYRGEHRANQDSFTGIEIRIPLARGKKVLKPVLR